MDAEGISYLRRDNCFVQVANQHGMRNLGSADVMRFLGPKMPQHGGVSGKFQGEVVGDLKHRPEGMRIKHRLNSNSIKMYDKQGSVLRVETRHEIFAGRKEIRA